MKKQFLKATSALLASAMLFTASCKKPSASFTADKSTVLVGEAVTFTNTSKDDASVSWDFGDGGESGTTSKTVTHTYAKAGTYSVTLMVSKGNGKKPSTAPAVTITVKDPEIPAPVADFTISNATPKGGDVVTFTSTSTNASEFSWDFGDGSVTPTTPNATHAYANDGAFVVTLTVKDVTKTLSSTKTMTVTVSSGSVQGNLVGTWNVAVNYTPNWSLVNGSACSLTLGATSVITSAAYSSITIGSNGSLVTGVVANPTAQAGNVNSLSSISVVDVNHILVNPNLFNMGSMTASVMNGGSTFTTISVTTAPTGVYEVTSYSQNNIVLTKKLAESNTSFATCNSNALSVTSNDVYTITLTR